MKGVGLNIVYTAVILVRLEVRVYCCIGSVHVHACSLVDQLQPVDADTTQLPLCSTLPLLNPNCYHPSAGLIHVATQENASSA